MISLSIPDPLARVPLRLLAAFVACVALADCASPPHRATSWTLPSGSHYVAMGSSFAAGPGITTIEPGTPARCTRSVDNYAHQLARRRGLMLADVSCGGATTAHVLGAWNELPAQLDALRADTQLVTVTIGGNDLNYMGVLFGASCKSLQRAGTAAQGECRDSTLPTEQDYAGLASRMARIATEVHRRSPAARLVFVDYVTVLPPTGQCAVAPLSDADADSARALDLRLRQITAAAARDGGAELLAAGALTRDHHACAAEPWINGLFGPDPRVPVVGFHPRREGMTAVAEALDRLLSVSPQ